MLSFNLQLRHGLEVFQQSYGSLSDFCVLTRQPVRSQKIKLSWSVSLGSAYKHASKAIRQAKALGLAWQSGKCQGKVYVIIGTLWAFQVNGIPQGVAPYRRR